MYGALHVFGLNENVHLVLTTMSIAIAYCEQQRLSHLQHIGTTFECLYTWIVKTILFHGEYCFKLIDLVMRIE